MTEANKPHLERVEKVREVLRKFHVESHLVDAASSERHDLEAALLRKQQAAELERRLDKVHEADLADLCRGQ